MSASSTPSMPSLLHFSDERRLAWEMGALPDRTRLGRHRLDEPHQRGDNQNRPREELALDALPVASLPRTVLQDLVHQSSVTGEGQGVAPPLDFGAKVFDGRMGGDCRGCSAVQLAKADDRLHCCADEPERCGEPGGGQGHQNPVVGGTGRGQGPTGYRHDAEHVRTAGGCGKSARFGRSQAPLGARNDETPHAGGVCVSWTGSALCPRRR